MKRKTTKELLAEFIERDLNCTCYPEDLFVNRGGNRYNDWCSWTGEIINHEKFSQICSWDNMGAIVKACKQGATISIVNPHDHIVAELTFKHDLCAE